MIAKLSQWWHKQLGHYVGPEERVKMISGAKLLRRACTCGAKWYRPRGGSR